MIQVVKVGQGQLTCRAQNDAVLDGLITVIHSEQASDGMSSYQVRLPGFTQKLDKQPWELCEGSGL